MLLVNINAHAQASAESLIIKGRFSFEPLVCFPICSRFREASTLQRTEQNFVLASSRLPQYYRLAPLGHNISTNFLKKATITSVLSSSLFAYIIPNSHPNI